jgi:hypothetical protein
VGRRGRGRGLGERKERRKSEKKIVHTSSAPARNFFGRVPAEEGKTGRSSAVRDGGLKGR